MTSIKITIVEEPPNPGNPSERELYAGFFDAVSTHAGTPVAVAAGRLADVAPDAGFILLLAQNDPVISLGECGPRQSELAARTVSIGVGRTRIFERVLEPLSLAGAVDELSLHEWSIRNPDAAGARGLHGLSRIGALVGASCLLFESERYCYLDSPTHRGLPHLLVDYLVALQRELR